MRNVHAIKELLYKIKQTSGWPRIEFIRSLQTIILDEAGNPGDDMEDVFTNLADDLNFYDNSPDRDEQLGYYGDDKLAEIINIAIKKTEAYEAGKSQQ